MQQEEGRVIDEREFDVSLCQSQEEFSSKKKETGTDVSLTPSLSMSH
jgi:hypothetical protein